MENSLLRDYIFWQKKSCFKVKKNGFAFFSKSFLLFATCFFPAVLLFSQTIPPSSAQKTLDIYKSRDPLDSLADHSILKPAQTFDSKRFWIVTGSGAALYGAITYGLYNTWYSDYDRGPFRTIDDWPEWMQMDKAGHTFTAYQYARYVQAGAEWTGMNKRKAAWTSFGVSTLFQGTLEMLDAYSEGWGFSWSDIGANTLGASFHLGQELLWEEQRILLKVSSTLKGPPDIPITNVNGATSNLGYVSRLRYGSGMIERFLKDYNEQTVWLSINPRSFMRKSNIPAWLNIAVGYGAQNVYGAYGNSWSQDGQSFSYGAPRYRQWFLSPDIYFSRIPTKKRWVRFLLGSLDFFKFPAPALEYSNGSFKGKLLMW